MNYKSDKSVQPLHGHRLRSDIPKQQMYLCNGGEMKNEHCTFEEDKDSLSTLYLFSE